MSIWNKNIEKRNIKELKQDKNVDILIIGAGMTGMTSAYYLQNEKSVCVVDAGLIGHGVTLNSTAKINYLQESLYTKITKAVSYRKASKYLESQKTAISYIKDIIKKEKIDCNFEKVPSYLFANSKSEINTLNQEMEFLKQNNIEVREKELPIDANSYKTFCVEDTYIFNPIKYLNGLYNILSNKIEIYENSKIVKIDHLDDKYICYGENFKITAKKVVLACHYPFFIIPFLMPLKCSLEKSYIIVSKTLEDKKFTCITTNKPVFSCRYYKDGKNIYQISLAKSSELSKNQNDKYYFKRVEEIFNLDEKDIVMKYTNTDIITPDYMPFIGELKPNLYIAVGYNTWGMTNSVIAGKIISDKILGIDNEFIETFKPTRISLQNIIKLPIYMFNNTKSLLCSKIDKNKSWYSDNIKFINKDGKSLGIYVDEKNKEHIIYNKCPHFGCSLIFNETEKTWDCPCHSSRFNIDGKCIKGPSNYDISYKE